MSPIVSPRPRAGSRHGAGAGLRMLDAAKPRVSPAPSGEANREAAQPRRPALRLVPGGGRDGGERASAVAPVLLAGANGRGREILRAELGATLAPRTRWVEAADIAGVLEHAAFSRMVILAGDLEDADADSLMHLLGRRHPELPVIRIDAPLPAAAAAAGGCG
jgi:hypothetical protein